MAQKTIEVIIKSDDKATSGINKVSKSLLGLGDSADSAFAPMSKLGSFLSNTFSTAAGMIIANTVGSIADRITSLGRAMIDTNADMEVFTSQFTTLLGSEELAQQRLKEITDFAKKTPFDLPGVIEANRMLTVFGEGVLDTAEMMTLIGDAAAGANTDFAELSMWVGRAYSNIQAGRPFGEASMRLMELGLLTGEQRVKLEDLTAAGADSSVVWGELTKALGKFGGEMETQSATFRGISSNVSDTWEAITRTIGEPVFDFAKENAQSLLTFLESDFAKNAVVAIRGFIADSIEAFKQFRNTVIETIGEITSEIKAFFGALSTGNVEQIAKTFADLATGIINVGASLLGLDAPIQRFGDEYTNAVEGFARTINTMFEFIERNADTIRGLAEAFAKAIITLTGAAKAIGLVSTAVKILMGVLSPLNLLIAAVTAAFFAWDQNLFGIQDTVKNVAQTIERVFGPAIQEIVEGLSTGNLDKALKGVVNFGKTFIKTIEGLASNIGTAVQTWAAEFTKNVVPQIPEIARKIWDFVTSLGNEIRRAVPQIITAISDWARGILDNMVPSYRAIDTELQDFIKRVVIWIYNAANTLADTLTEWTVTFIQWIGQATREFLPKLGEFIGKVVKFLIAEGIPALVGFIAILIKDLVPRLADISTALFEFLTNDLVPAMIDFGKQIAGGILAGLWELSQMVRDFFDREIKGRIEASWDSIFGPSGAIQRIAREAAASILEFFVDAFEGIAGGLGDIFPGIKEAIANMRGEVSKLRAEADAMAQAQSGAASTTATAWLNMRDKVSAAFSGASTAFSQGRNAAIQTADTAKSAASVYQSAFTSAANISAQSVTSSQVSMRSQLAQTADTARATAQSISASFTGAVGNVSAAVNGIGRAQTTASSRTQGAGAFSSGLGGLTSAGAGGSTLAGVLGGTTTAAATAATPTQNITQNLNFDTSGIINAIGSMHQGMDTWGNIAGRRHSELGTWLGIINTDVKRAISEVRSSISEARNAIAPAIGHLQGQVIIFQQAYATQAQKTEEFWVWWIGVLKGGIDFIGATIAHFPTNFLYYMTQEQQRHGEMKQLLIDGFRAVLGIQPGTTATAGGAAVGTTNNYYYNLNITTSAPVDVPTEFRTMETLANA